MRRDIYLISIFGIEFDLPLLRAWLEHYLGLGIRSEHIILIIHHSRGELFQEAEAICTEYGVTPREYRTGPFCEFEIFTQLAQIINEVVPDDTWFIRADSDEFYDYGMDLHGLCEILERMGVNIVQGYMIDRVAPDGRLAEYHQDTAIADQFPVATHLTSKLAGVTYKKTLLSRGVMLGPGAHEPEPNAPGPAPKFFLGRPVPANAPVFLTRRWPFISNHYKWHATLERRTLDRIEVLKANTDHTRAEFYHDVESAIVTGNFASVAMQLSYTRPSQSQLGAWRWSRVRMLQLRLCFLGLQLWRAAKFARHTLRTGIKSLAGL